ncbi:hypothetical protein JCM8202_003768 [Rhodotorula sphaerocarpa]
MLNRDALLFSPTREGVPSSDDFYASDIVAAQEALEAEAREAVRYASECTYDLGHIKQPLYACRTCLNHGAVCVACSVACHAEHDLVELFNRRDFRCDCGTERLGAGSRCEISGRADAPRNTRNRYDHNFRGDFCWCGRPYDPHVEENDMVQCVVCEDWLHEPCLMGRQAGKLAPKAGVPSSDQASGPADDEGDGGDGRGPVLPADEFDTLICQRCVRQHADLRQLLEHYAGLPASGVMVISERDEVLGRCEAGAAVEGDGAEAAADGDEANPTTSGLAEKTVDETEGTASRTEGSQDGGERPAKRPRVAGPADPEPLTRSAEASPVAETNPPSEVVQPKRDELLTTGSATLADAAPPESCRAPRKPASTSEWPLVRLERLGARVNVYLQEGFMDRWCRCSECLSTLLKYPYLLEEEEVHEPAEEEDEEAPKSTFELGMEHLLTRMPRGQALDSINAFSQLSDRLRGFLRPHAEGGTAVTKADIERFFAAEREQRAQREQ